MNLSQVPKGLSSRLILLAIVLGFSGLAAASVWAFKSFEAEGLKTALSRKDAEIEALRENGGDGPRSASLRGSLISPPEKTIDGVAVCAFSLETRRSFCTQDKLQDAAFKGGTGFEIKVDPGTYFLFAYLQNEPNRVSQLAMYNQKLRSIELENKEVDICNSPNFSELLDPVLVTVRDKEALSNIIVGDWTLATELVGCGAVATEE